MPRDLRGQGFRHPQRRRRRPVCSTPERRRVHPASRRAPRRRLHPDRRHHPRPELRPDHRGRRRRRRTPLPPHPRPHRSERRPPTTSQRRPDRPALAHPHRPTHPRDGHRPVHRVSVAANPRRAHRRGPRPPHPAAAPTSTTPTTCNTSSRSPHPSSDNSAPPGPRPSTPRPCAQGPTSPPTSTCLCSSCGAADMANQHSDTGIAPTPPDDPSPGRATDLGRARSDSNDTTWTVESVRNLGLTTDIETAASILGIGRTKAYELAKASDFPVPLLRIGRRYIVPVPAILRVLGSE